MYRLYRHPEALYRFAILLLLVSVGFAVVLVRSTWQIPGPAKSARPAVAGLTHPVPATIPATTGDWRVFVRSGSGTRAQSPVLERYRLAGTFFAMDSHELNSRKAIIHELATGVQRIVQESESIDGLRVVKVYRDHVIVNDGAADVELRLGFIKRGGSGTGTGAESAGAGQGTRGLSDWLGGQQVGEHSWVFQRDRLLQYYQELLDDPERLVKVFDTLKPVYDESNKITGYRVGIEGEKPFFDAVGLAEGDVVRSVNSMKMTSRRRAEYFITEFVRDRVNAFLIDVERGGGPVRLMYHVR